ncbi:enoyl-CoA-hydratase DpgB [Streptomyces violaceusniger]|uniref:enoyl-CoA-hydratase DpgB n=1 Tax=Streptomyces violaceusniger TaxID=68280 RepID=UPI0036C2F741
MKTSDGSGLVAQVDGTQPLPDLTAFVNSVCDEVESRPQRTTVILDVVVTEPEDIRGWPGEVGVQAVNRWERAVRRLERISAVTVIAARGTCAGPALDLLLAADFRIGAADLQLVLPVNDGHIWPGMALYRLVQHLGLARARQIVMRGDAIPAAQAADLGLIDQVSDDVATAAHAATVLLGPMAGREITVRRQLLLEAVSAEYDDALGVHLAACDRELRRLRAGTESAIPESAERSRT